MLPMRHTSKHTQKHGIFQANGYIQPQANRQIQACRKHPRHRQSPGVRSICLSEKLSQLSSSSSSSSSSKSVRSQFSSSLSSYVSSLSSSNASSCSSPVVHVDMMARKSMRVFKGASKNVLKKSRSMAFVSRRLKQEEEENGEKIFGVKGGFWSKLLPRRSGKLMHSRTMRERIITEVP